MYISQKMSIFIIMGVMEHINIRSSQIGVEKKENCKFTTLLVFNLFMLFPFFIVKNASRYSNSYCPFSRLPLASYEDRAAFKIFVLDVGLLGAMSNLKATTIVAGNSIFTEFKGALTEQYVLQQLILRYEPYYYAKTNSTQEIDFLLQDEEDEIVPLEVKAETNVKAKSLRQFVADNQSKKAYRISMNDYQQEDWVTNVPLYAVNDLEF